MYVRHWNATRENETLTGVGRYDEELFSHLSSRFGGSGDGAIDRVQRPSAPVRGSTFVSWLTTYDRGPADVVHATDETLAPVSYLRDVGSFVVTCHDVIPLRYPSTVDDLTTWLQWKVVPRAIKRADRIITVSAFTKRELRELLGVPAGRIHVVHHGVDHDAYRPMDRRACKEAFGLDPGNRHVLVVSSNLEHKRMDLVVETFERLQERRDDVVLLKAGYGETLEGDRVVSTGWVPEEDMPSLYNAADVYFHPSEYEGFGLPVLEAMACGRPVVVSDGGSVPEVVGDAGRMVPLTSDDVAGRFADEIEEALPVDVDDGALERSRTFRWERTAEETLAVYRKAAGST